MKDVLRILFMEQSVAIRERMAELITESMEDAEIHHADGAEEAINKIRKHQPHVLFIDSGFRLPLLTEFIETAKAELPRLHVVVLYIQMNPVLREKCRVAGAAEFLDKYEQFDQVTGLLYHFRLNLGI